MDFIDIMNDRNLLLTGEYVVLAIDNSIDDVSDNQVGHFCPQFLYLKEIKTLHVMKVPIPNLPILE